MSKIKVLCLSLWYPLTMSRYFEKAMKHNENIDLKTTGVYTGSWIPWMGGMNLPEKYAKPCDLSLAFPPNVGRVSYDYVKAQLGDWKPDIVMSIDAGINWSSKPSDGLVVTVATDPHALDYSHQRSISDKFFNMQLCYSEPKDVYLPYAYSKYDHFVESHATTNEVGSEVWTFEKNLDAVLIGMPYTHVPRAQWIEELKSRGVKVFSENGPVFDEYREIANRAYMGLNWSSERDLNARFFENAAFKLAPVANIVPDAHLYLTEGRDYLGFTTLPEAIEKVLYLKDHPSELMHMAENAHEKIKPHTYDARVDSLLKECGFS